MKQLSEKNTDIPSPELLKDIETFKLRTVELLKTIKERPYDSYMKVYSNPWSLSDEEYLKRKTNLFKSSNPENMDKNSLDLMIALFGAQSTLVDSKESKDCDKFEYTDWIDCDILHSICNYQIGILCGNKSLNNYISIKFKSTQQLINSKGVNISAENFVNKFCELYKTNYGFIKQFNYLSVKCVGFTIGFHTGYAGWV